MSDLGPVGSIRHGHGPPGGGRSLDIISSQIPPTQRLCEKSRKSPNFRSRVVFFGVRRPLWWFVSRMGGGAFAWCCDNYAPRAKAPPRIRETKNLKGRRTPNNSQFSNPGLFTQHLRWWDLGRENVQTLLDASLK